MKRSVSGIIATSIFSYLFWILFVWQGNFKNIGAQELITGAVISLIIGYFTSPLFVKEDGFWIFKKGRILRLILYIPFYFVELVKANIDVAKRAFTGDVNPKIVRVSTNLNSDYGLAFLANSITLTPGTITIKIVEENNKNYLYIHWINCETTDEEKCGKIIKDSFEKRIRRIFK